MQGKPFHLAASAVWLVLLLVPALVSPAAGAAPKKAAAPAPAPAACNDVSWLNPPNPPPFLTDFNQAPGTGNCQFQEFASWNFMALVLGNSPLFESWPTTEQVFPANGRPTCSGAPLGSSVSPIILQNGAGFLQVRSKLAAANNLAAPPVQATGQPVVDRNGRYIQYEMRLNPVLCQAVSSCQLYTRTCVNSALQAKPAFVWPSGNTQTPGVAELKLSWRVMETCNLPDSPSPCRPDNLHLYFWVDNVTVESLGPKWQGPARVTLGLVGFHLIQKTPLRPEFVWATWEHTSNDPVCPGSDNSQCQDPSHANGGVSTPSGWSFFDAKVTPLPLLNQPPQCPDAAIDPANPKQANCLNSPYYVATAPQSQPKTEVCRMFPCGGGDQTEIADLNEAIRGKLAGNVWWNYFLEGTVWGNHDITQNPTGPTDSAGSIYLANTTMETFFQNTAFNCFTCHQSGAAGGYQPSDGGFVNLDFVHSLISAQQAGSSCGVNFATCAQMPGPQTKPAH